MAHTPGPFRYGTSHSGIQHLVYAPTGDIIATCFKPSNDSIPETISNGQLFAAAPDLLLAGKHLALKLAEVYRAAGIDPRGCQALLSWMAAVAKSEGR